MSTFTALNGGSPKSTEQPNGALELKTASNEASVKPPSPVSEQPKPASEGLASSSQRERDREHWTASSIEKPTYQSANYPDMESSHKRKRSTSVEPRRDRPATLERSPDSARPPHQPESREPYATPQRDFRPYVDEGREHGDTWYSRQEREEHNPYDSQQHSASTTHGQTEDQIGEALQRATAGPMLDHHSDYPQTSPDGDDRAMSLYSPYGTDSRRDGMGQIDPKKRKRVFSNRTKTGCLTCRKRKKKCDEQKPECRNCIKGDFHCAGYPPQRGTSWQKPDNKPAAIPLESKDPSYVPPGAYGMPQQQQGPYGSQPVKREPLPHYRGQPGLRIDPPQGRPLMTDDDRQTASTIPSASVTSPENKLSAIYTPANVFPTPISAVSSVREPVTFATPKDYQPRVPPLHDLTRTEPESSHPPQLPQINILHPTRTSSPIVQPPATTNAQMAALALSHTNIPSNRPRREKDEMLAGRHYYPFDKELVKERERCSAACWRFNNSTNPNNGVSDSERARLFCEILQPRDPIQISPTQASPVTKVGRVGDKVCVEAPFTCDYGYNITIGRNVVVGRNCTIIDTCEVKIGDNCHIGPNVSIYTMTLPIDPKRRQGAEGPALGRGITIEPDCWIGGGAIILPGRTIGKGSTVGAGAIVTKDVPPFTIVVGNPARVLRGISS